MKSILSVYEKIRQNVQNFLVKVTGLIMNNKDYNKIKSSSLYQKELL
jgi:hypothetical protein